MSNNPHVLALAILLAAQSPAQAPPVSPLTFEVASIKPSDPGGGGAALLITPGGGLNGRNLTLKVLIQRAYYVLDFQISGGPAWINSERYDIEAKPERTSRDESVPNDLSKLTAEQGKTFQDQFIQRLQALLADRFQLELRRETKELPVFALVVIKNGPKLPEAKNQDTNSPRGLRLQRGRLNANGIPIASLTRFLSQQLGRPVLDETKLKGNYDFTLQWTPDQVAPPPPDATAAQESGGPSIFTAVQEQLGLKLESRKGPVEIFVIEHAEHPSEN